jgi:NTE family protein
VSSQAQPQAPSWSGQADGVFRGGGVKGLALAGALNAFHAHPKWPVHRWVNVAGASAGAIIASYLAFDKSEQVGENMIALLDPKKLATFQDFPFHNKLLGGVPRLILRHGMAPGDKFVEWFDGVLKGSTFSIATDEAAQAFARSQGADMWVYSRLKLIAADVTNRRLLVLPEDLPKYRLVGHDQPIDPMTFPISHAARMSMSIPYFFQPVEIERIVGDDGKEIRPVRSTIVDGGTLSNFPVWIFDVGEPRRPTFGFTLTGGTGVGGGFTKMTGFLPWGLRLAFDIFHTAQEAWDERFQSHSTNVRTFASSATVQLPGGRTVAVNTTDFALTDDLKNGLIQNGVDAANAFLDKFDPANYFNTLHKTL